MPNKTDESNNKDLSDQEISNSEDIGDQEIETDDDLVVPEILHDAPPAVKRMVTEMMMVSSSRGGLPNSIAKKVTSEHITQVIDATKEESEREYKDTFNSRIFSLIYTILGMLLFVFLIVYLKDNPELLGDILKVGSGFLAGLGGAYAIERYRKRRQ